MRASELRIGNWVYLFGDPVQLTKEHIIYLLGKDSLPESVTLTEEWLLKFGFEKLSNFEEQYMEEDYVWQIDVERSPSLILSNGIFHEDNYGVKLEYVHQLQNLYFALTGEELTIKETV